jgi:hypothetical protein
MCYVHDLLLHISVNLYNLEKLAWFSLLVSRIPSAQEKSHASDSAGKARTNSMM